MTDLYKLVNNNSVVFDMAYKKSPAKSRALYNFFFI